MLNAMENINKSKPQYKLFIDELGTASIKDVQSDLYILAGCSVNENDRRDIKTWADHIKFKYWGRTDVVFHSREIGRRENDFKIFRGDEGLFERFLEDLGQFLLCSRFRMFFVVVDKEGARKRRWNDIKVYRETSGRIVRSFLLILLSGDSVGKIIIESATAEKDFYFHKALGYFLSEGIREARADYRKIQDAVTSISFVTKKNHDIEEQIADLFAYAAKCRFFKKRKREWKDGKYERMMLSLLEKKLFRVPKDASVRKMKYFKEVNPFEILP
jgi:hypothetical protein